jgi:Protein of unknown function (DUF3618)
MGQEPREIREEIENTRARMGDTVEALGYKTDVKTRAREKVSGAAGTAQEKVSGAAGVAQQNPFGLALGSVAVGFLAGMLIPSTRVEDSKLGEASDQVIDKVKETAREAGERGKHVAQEAAQSARDAAQQSGQEHAEQLRQSVQDKAQATAEQARA